MDFAPCAVRLLATALCFAAAGADSPPEDGPELHQPEAQPELEKAPPMAHRARAKKDGPDAMSKFVAWTSIAALIVAMVVPLFLLMRTQKKGDQQEEKNKAAELARELAKNTKKEAKLERGVGKKKKKGGIEAMKAASKAGAGADDDGEGGEAKSGAQAKRAEREAAIEDERRAAAEEAAAPREGETPKDAAKRMKEEAREARQLAREEAARVAKEEEERRKQEEYDKWKDMFSVDDAGEEVGAEAEDEGRLLNFVTHIKQQKVAVLEDLASEFGLKVVDVISRVQALEQMGYLSGVVDDRGKFIYIERREMQEMAQFIKKKGRVRISALAHESSSLIDLEPKLIGIDDAEEEAAAEGEATAAL